MPSNAHALNTRADAVAHANAAVDRVAELPGVTVFDRLALLRHVQMRLGNHIWQLTKQDDAERAERAAKRANS